MDKRTEVAWEFLTVPLVDEAAWWESIRWLLEEVCHGNDLVGSRCVHVSDVVPSVGGVREK